MNFTKNGFFDASKIGFISAILISALLMLSFFAMEPSISAAQATANNTFTVKQTIGDAIAFEISEAGVVMVGSIDGVAGGQATGTATVVVSTNDNDGYNMTISFLNATSAMRGDTTGSTALQDYTPATTSEPSYNFEAEAHAQFAYTVTASSSSDVNQLFLDDGTNCNQAAGSSNNNKCWFRPSDADFEIINRSTSASNGATTTIVFSVHVPNAPVPAVIADTYTATATLTATNNI